MSTILERLEYGFDRDSRRTWRKRSLTTGEDNAYGYDGLSQVVNAARGNLNLNATAIGGVPAEAQAWDYDPTGNWRGYETQANGNVALDQARVHDKGNRLTQIEGAPNPVLLDRAGRMREVSPDATGNWNQSQKITWDAWSRVVRIEQNGTTTGSYAYDGLTRRTTRSTGGTTWHSYYSDAWRPLEERRDSQTVPARQYFWGARHRDDLVRRDRAKTSGGPLDETRYVLMDYFSPAAITDETGAVKERYAFSTFGVRRILTPTFMDRATSECDFTFAFQGQFLDTESGFLNYGYRYYSPHLGRWLCKDPLGESAGSNLFLLLHNNPVNSADIEGLVGDEVDYTLEFTEGKGAGSTTTQLTLDSICAVGSKKCWVALVIRGSVSMYVPADMATAKKTYPVAMREGRRMRPSGLEGILMHEQSHAGAWRAFVQAMQGQLAQYEQEYDSKADADAAIDKAKAEFQNAFNAIHAQQNSFDPVDFSHGRGWNETPPVTDFKIRGNLRPY